MTKILSVSEQLKLAEAIAREAHKNQTRKFGKNEPYIVHPQRVAAKLAERYPLEPSYQIVAWLHDVLEDTAHTRESLMEQGIGEEYVVMVEALSRREGETYFDFIMRMKFAHMPRRVKMADVEDNMSDDLKEGSMKDKYRLALYVLQEFEKYWEEKGKKKD